MNLFYNATTVPSYETELVPIFKFQKYLFISVIRITIILGGGGGGECGIR